MHGVHHRDVRELEDRLVIEVLLHGVEYGVVDAPEPENQRIGVGEERPLQWGEQVRYRPGLQRLDLLLGETEGAARLAVLREHELAADQPTGPGLAQLPQLARDLAIGAGVQAE